ncbi:MAG: hypothetical protein AAB152_18925 [Candidatus Coatesbacteria bacterium]
MRISLERLEPHAFPDRAFNYVGLEHIEGHTGRLHSRGSTLGVELDSTKNVFHPGQILYGKLRPYLNKVHLAAVDGICSTDILVLSCEESRLVPAFAAYYLRSAYTLEAVRNRLVGANLPRVGRGDFLGLEIPVFPLTDQRRIVRMLDEAEDLRRLRDLADERTMLTEAALFLEMFGSPSVNPRDWPIGCVGDWFDMSRGGVKCGPFGSALKKAEYVESGIPVWGIPNVLPNRFVEAGSLFITRAKFAQLQSYAVEPGDLLISRAGTVGRMCVARPEVRESIIGTNLIRLTLDGTMILPEFFSTLLTHFASEVGHLRANTDESSYSFMSTTVLKSLRIYRPPLELQQRFVGRVAEISALEAMQAASRKRLDDLFESLLHRAFQGEL